MKRRGGLGTRRQMRAFVQSAAQTVGDKRSAAQAARTDSDTNPHSNHDSTLKWKTSKTSFFK